MSEAKAAEVASELESMRLAEAAKVVRAGIRRHLERMNQTLAREWQYARAWDSEASRADAPKALVDHYN